MNRQIFLVVILFFMAVQPAVALTKYGDANIKKGTLTILRNGQEQSYTVNDVTVEVQLNDVIRLGENSLVVLKTVEDTEVKMGSHAVFQVSPWKSRNKTGYLRMLYGKMNFKTKPLTDRRRFRLKTAAATISVKGTDGDVEVGSSGNTSCIGRSGVIGFQGNSGPTQDLSANMLAMAVSNKPVTQTIAIPQSKGPTGKDEAPDQDQLDKAPPTSPESSNLHQESFAVETGIVDQQDLEDSKQTEISSDVSFDQELEQQDEDKKIDNQEDIEQDQEFENDLQQNESSYEVSTVETDIPVDITGQVELETPSSEPEIPDVDVTEVIEDAVQESKNAAGRLNLNFDK